MSRSTCPGLVAGFLTLALCLALSPASAEVVRQVTDNEERDVVVTEPVQVVEDGVIAFTDLESTENPDRRLTAHLFPSVGGPPIVLNAAILREDVTVPFQASLQIDLSHDGRWFAFTTTEDLTGENADGNQELFVAGIDGSVRQLTQTSSALPIDSLAISANGDEIAFVSSRDFGDNPGLVPQVFRAARNGLVLQQLTSLTGQPVHGVDVDDDGVRYVFNVDGDVYLLQPSGQLLLLLIADVSAMPPAISRDGNRVAARLDKFRPVHNRDFGLALHQWNGTELFRMESLSTGGLGQSFPSLDLLISDDGDQTVWIGSNGTTLLIDDDGTTEQPPATPHHVDFDNEVYYIAGTTALSSVSSSGAWVELFDAFIPALDGPVEVSRDGSRGSYVDVDGDETVVADLVTLQEVDRVPGAGVISSEGDRIYFGQTYYDVGSGDPPQTIPDARSYCDPLGSAANGAILLICADETWVGTVDGGVRLLDCAGAGPSPCGAHRLSADGEWVVWKKGLSVFYQRVDGSEPVLALGPVRFFDPEPSPDGRFIVAGVADDPLGTNPDRNIELFLYEVETGAYTQLTDTLVLHNRKPQFRSDGRIVWYEFDGELRSLDLWTGADVARPEPIVRDSRIADNGNFLGLAPGDFAGLNPAGFTQVWLVESDRAVLEFTGGPSTEIEVLSGIGPIDVIRGNLEDVTSDGAGGVDLGSVLCLEEEATGTIEDTVLPTSGFAFFYLPRLQGTYGTSSAGEIRSVAFGDCEP